MTFKIIGLEDNQKEMFFKELTVLTDKYAAELAKSPSIEVVTPVGVLTVDAYHCDEYPSVHISFMNGDTQNYVATVEVMSESKLPRVLVYQNCDVDEPTDVINLNLDGAPKLFRCNGAVKEWCIARNKTEAHSFMSKFWDDGVVMEMYQSKFLKENPDKTLHDFIDAFFTEEGMNFLFTHPYAGELETPMVKLVSSWVNEADTVPSYLCYEK